MIQNGPTDGGLAHDVIVGDGDPDRSGPTLQRKGAGAHLALTVAVPGVTSAKRRSGCIVKAIAQPRSKSAIDTACPPKYRR
jgi:hypothetical protein